MGYIAYLERAGRKIQFDASGLFSLAPAWTPPTINLASTYASGTSASAYSPALKIAERTQQALISVPFHVRGATSSIQINDAISRVNAFLRDAGDENEPTYFVWLSSNDVPFIPTWGQTVRRLKISDGAAYFSGEYGAMGANQTALPRCRMDLTVCSIDGSVQQLAYAKGCVSSTRIGSADGSIVGVQVNPTETNKFLNPSFEYSTYDNGWTATDCVISQNTDPQYVISGDSSMKIVRTAATSPRVVVSINVGNTNNHVLSFYAIRKDGSAISGSNALVWYNGTTVTTSAINCGNGVYRMYAAFAGVNSAVEAGVRLGLADDCIYVDGFMLEETARLHPSPYFDCDYVGCAPTGTAHNSTSTAASGALVIENTDNTVLNLDEGTVRIIFRHGQNSDYSGGALTLWTAGADLSVIFSSGAYTFSDGTNSASLIRTFSAGDLAIVHASWGKSGLVLSVNGSTTSNANYTHPTIGDVYIGTNNVLTGTNYLTGMISDFVIWPRAMTSVQMTADYNNQYPIAASFRAVSLPPYLWTQDGDGVIDDVTDADQAAYGVIGGIVGDVPCDLSIVAHLSGTDDLTVGIYATDTFVEQTQMYDSATVSIDTTPGTGINPEINLRTAKMLRDYPVYLFSEIDDDGTNNLEINAILYSSNAYLTADTAINSLEEQTIDVPSSPKGYLWVGLRIPTGLDGIAKIKYILDYRRTSGAAANVTTNAVLWFGGMATITGYPVTTGGGFLIVGNRAYQANYTTGKDLVPLVYLGSPMVAIPGKINHIFAAGSEFDSVTPDPWYPATIDKCSYAPIYLNA